MPRNPRLPRLGFLGAGPDELELMLELHGQGAAEIIGVYDLDPRAPGLAIAEVAGIPAGTDFAALERLGTADAIVLPRDRHVLREAIRWAGGLRCELVSLPEARQRWSAAAAGSGTASQHVPAVTTADEGGLQQALDTSARLQDRRELGDWLLGIALHAAGANGGSIQLLAPDSGELYLLVARGLSERLVHLGRHRLGDGISGMVAAMRAPQLVHGVKPGRIVRERGDIAAAMILPLEAEGQLVGVLNVSSTRPGQRFGDSQLRRLERLAPRIAGLLRDATRLEPPRAPLDIPRLLRQLEASNQSPRTRLTTLCDHVRVALGADAATLYLSTDDGDWLRLLPERAGEATPPGGVRHAALDTALTEMRWVHVSPGGAEPVEGDALSAAVERALGQAGARSQVYAPLHGVEPLGVVVLEFVALEAADRASRDGHLLVEQLAFACDTVLREHRQRRRLERYAALARAVHRLHESAGKEPLDATLAAEAARLVGARRAFVRRVVEEEHTFSRPATAGVELVAFPTWRELDARITERTLQMRRALLSTAADDSAESTGAGTPRCSLVSVPFLHRGQIVAILNVYEKQPQDFLENHAFTGFDRDLLESLGLVMAWCFTLDRSAGVAVERAGARSAGEILEAARPENRLDLPPTRSQPRAAPHLERPGPAVDETSSSNARIPAAAPVAPAPPVAPELELQSLVQEAAREQRGLGVWLLHFAGLAGLGEAAESARRGLAATVQRGLRGGDRIAWMSGQDLAVFGFEPPPPSVGFEARLANLVRPTLLRLARETESHIDLRIGASAFPADGFDPIRLLAAAAERAR